MTQGQPEEYSEENVNELVGGIKNALDRGEDVNKAKQSFFNAGYTKKEIDEATAVLGISEPVQAQKVLTPTSLPIVQKTSIELNNSKPTSVVQKPVEQILPQGNIVFPSKKEIQKLPVAQFKEPQKLNKALVIILILLGILFVVIAGFLGVYWDQLFGPF